MIDADFAAGMDELAATYNERTEGDVWARKVATYRKTLVHLPTDVWEQALALYIQDHRFFPKPNELLAFAKIVRQSEAAGKGLKHPCSECGQANASIRTLCPECFYARNGTSTPLFTSPEERERYEAATAKLIPQGRPVRNALRFCQAIVLEATGVAVEV